MWHLKTTTVLGIKGALGMIKGTDKDMNKIPGGKSLVSNGVETRIIFLNQAE